MGKFLKLISLCLLITITFQKATAQECHFIDPPFDTDTTKGLRESKNGWHLPVNGVIRVLIIFVEMNYTSGTDPAPGGKPGWPAHQMPRWKDSLCDHDIPSGIPQGYLTRYFQVASSGNYWVLGDYLVAPDNGGIFSINTTTGEYSLSEAIASVNQKLGNNIVTRLIGNCISSSNIIEFAIQYFIIAL